MGRVGFLCNFSVSPTFLDLVLRIENWGLGLDNKRREICDICHNCCTLDYPPSDWVNQGDITFRLGF